MIRGCITSYQAEPAEWRVAGEGLASPSRGGRQPMEADLVMAGGAAVVVGAGLGVSSWNGGRRPWGEVWDPRQQGGWDWPVEHLHQHPSRQGLGQLGPLRWRGRLVGLEWGVVHGSPGSWPSALPHSWSIWLGRQGSIPVWP